MSQQEIDDYLANLDEPKRTTLQQLRQTIQSIIPDAEQGISYGMPAFRLHGKVIAGFAAFKNHLSYLPHSGSEGCIAVFDRQNASQDAREKAHRRPSQGNRSALVRFSRSTQIHAQEEKGT
jgi:uncharacterized protein YdhG (YjbR/CyaY superfamily)